MGTELGEESGGPLSLFMSGCSRRGWYQFIYSAPHTRESADRVLTENRDLILDESVEHYVV